jgi:hypothetical protein
LKKKTQKRHICTLKRENPSSLSEEDRSSDLAARLAAPQSFIDKETPGQLLMNLPRIKKKSNWIGSRPTQPKQQFFIDTGNKEGKFPTEKKKMYQTWEEDNQI